MASHKIADKKQISCNPGVGRAQLSMDMRFPCDNAEPSDGGQLSKYAQKH